MLEYGFYTISGALEFRLPWLILKYLLHTYLCR
jgi:hypothetical protein